MRKCTGHSGAKARVEPGAGGVLGGVLGGSVGGCVGGAEGGAVGGAIGGSEGGCLGVPESVGRRAGCAQYALESDGSGGAVGLLGS